MSSGPIGKGPRLWLQPERTNRNGSVEPARWIIRDGNIKRSTGLLAHDAVAAQRALAEYIAAKHDPRAGVVDARDAQTADILTLYARDKVPGLSRPTDTASRIRRLAGWWCVPDAATRSMINHKRPVVRLTGTLRDISASTCASYIAHVGAVRSGTIDLEIFRAAINHAVREQVIDRPVLMTLPKAAPPRERWLTRSEVAKLVWLAWKGRRKANGRSGTSDALAPRKHLARFILLAVYTGTRKSALLNASFKRSPSFGYIDLEAGLWQRRAENQRVTNKRQPTVPLPRPLIAHLRRWKENGQTHPVEFYGAPVKRIDKAFRELVKDARLEGEVVPHTLRHTAITWGMQRGMDLWQASGYFGVSTQVLLEVYGHHHPDHLRSAADVMSRPRRP